MKADLHEYDARTHQSAFVSALIIGSALFVAVVLSAVLLYWFLLRQSSGQGSIGSIADTIPTTEPDETTKAALIVLDGATQVRRDPGAYGSFGVAYALTEKHPASNAIQQISSRLKSVGWKPLKDDWLNPGLPSSHVRGWTDFIDGTKVPMVQVHQWGAQWQDKSGNIVDYTLRYSYPESGTPDLQSLWIDASWFPAASVKIMQTP